MSTTEQTYGGWYPDTTSAGWQCGKCGQWCTFGNYHTCTASPPPNAYDRIAAALERIAASLEAGAT